MDLPLALGCRLEVDFDDTVHASDISVFSVFVRALLAPCIPALKDGALRRNKVTLTPRPFVCNVHT